MIKIKTGIQLAIAIIIAFYTSHAEAQKTPFGLNSYYQPVQPITGFYLT